MRGKLIQLKCATKKTSYDEIEVILKSNAVGNPWAVVIKPSDALSANLKSRRMYEKVEALPSEKEYHLPCNALNEEV
jgi:hypothetical protein